jgi:hypothetical protein
MICISTWKDWLLPPHSSQLSRGKFIELLAFSNMFVLNNCTMKVSKSYWFRII